MENGVSGVLDADGCGRSYGCRCPGGKKIKAIGNSSGDDDATEYHSHLFLLQMIKCEGEEADTSDASDWVPGCVGWRPLASGPGPPQSLVKGRGNGSTRPSRPCPLPLLAFLTYT